MKTEDRIKLFCCVWGLFVQIVPVEIIGLLQGCENQSQIQILKTIRQKENTAIRRIRIEKESKTS
jgi:hypothetical protein